MNLDEWLQLRPVDRVAVDKHKVRMRGLMKKFFAPAPQVYVEDPAPDVSYIAPVGYQGLSGSEPPAQPEIDTPHGWWDETDNS